MAGEDGGGGGGGGGGAAGESAAPPPPAGGAGAAAGPGAQQGENGGRPAQVQTNGLPLEHVTSPMSPRTNTPNPFSRKNTSLDLDDYFVRQTRFHSHPSLRSGH